MAHNHTHPTSDFKQLKPGPEYYGPSDQTLIEYITMFGSRRQCTHAELIKQFSTGHASWKESTQQKLDRMVEEGKLIFVDGGEPYYRPTRLQTP